jgi:hypothetical protein
MTKVNARQKIKLDCERHNKLAFELHLFKVVKKMCHHLGMNLDDWEIDETLYRAIKTHKKFESLVAISSSYDKLYDVATTLKVVLDPKFKWLHRINENQNNKQTK